MTELEIGRYRLAVNEEETARQYAALPPYAGSDVGVRLFRHCLKKLALEDEAFLRSLGIDPAKLFAARPLAEPDDKGVARVLCACRLCGTLLCPEESPRRSVVKGGLQLTFTGDRRCFTPSLADFPAPELEMRFVASLPFDPDYLKELFL